MATIAEALSKQLHELDQNRRQLGNMRTCQKQSLTSNVNPISWAMSRVGVSPRFEKADFKDFEIKIPDCSLFVTGPRGTGKTHLLAAICKDYILKTKPSENHQFPKFITVPELMLKFKNTFDRKSPGSETEVLNEFSSPPALFLDDLGVEKVSDWSIQMLYLLIDRRYRDMKPVWISSNLSLDEIAAKLDDRISSRIAGMCMTIELKGKDKRIGG